MRYLALRGLSEGSATLFSVYHANKRTKTTFFRSFFPLFSREKRRLEPRLLILFLPILANRQNNTNNVPVLLLQRGLWPVVRLLLLKSISYNKEFFRTEFLDISTNSGSSKPFCSRSRLFAPFLALKFGSKTCYPFFDTFFIR